MPCLVVFSFLFQIISIITAQRICPLGWIVSETAGKCMKITIKEVSASWQDARDSCLSYKSDLLSIDSVQEKEYVDRLVNSNINPEFWIGGQRRASDNTWIWVNKNVYINNVVQLSWIAGRPDDESGNCLQIANQAAYSNEDCSASKPYICSRPIGLAVGCDIDDRWEPVQNTCIKVFALDRTWKESRQTCLNEGGDLIVVTDVQTQDYLRDWLKVYRKSFWIGLSDIVKDDGIFQWVDSTSFSSNQLYWASLQPQYITDNGGNCTAVTDLISGLWSIQSCTKSNNFACQRAPGQCPDGWRVYKNKCYLFNEQRELHTSWFEANLTCSNYRANLLNIKDVFIQKFVERELQSTYTSQDFWLGLTDLLPVKNKYYWSDGQEVNGYTSWMTGYPVSLNTRDNCGIISSTEGSWYVTSNCFLKQPFICEVDISEVNNIIPNPSLINTFGGNANTRPCVFPFIYKSKTYYGCISNDRDAPWCSTTSNYDLNNQWGYCPYVSVCEAGWDELGPSCYKKIDEDTSTVSWISAESNCTRIGGHLAKITSTKIQSLINNMITLPGNAWFGLYSVLTSYPHINYQWIWTSDDQVLESNNFKNWKIGISTEPEVRQCVALTTETSYFGEWIPVSCQNYYSTYICERPPNGQVLPSQASTPVTQPFSEKCGIGWAERPFSSSCYLFKNEYATKDEALSKCTSNGGTLVSILDVNEQTFIQNYLASYPLSIELFWIAASRESPSKGWSWDDKSAFIFANWAQGEYNTGTNQYCAVLSTQYMGAWKTVDCSISTKFAYICKKRQTGVTQPTMSTAYPLPNTGNYGCKDGWKAYKNNYCYQYFNDKYSYKTFNEAKSTCKSYGAELVEIFNEAENDFVGSILLQAAKIKMRTANNLLNSTKSKQVLACPDKWTQQGDSCYRVIVDTPSTWKRAQEVCSNLDGTLVSIKNSDENNYVSNIVQSDYWIGLKRMPGSVLWEWDDGPIANSIYTNWDTSFPTNQNTTERCVQTAQSKDYKWRDADCDTLKLKYVCKRPLSYQDQCTQFENVLGSIAESQYHGTCVHKDQCPLGLFTAINFCLDTNNQNYDIVCCLTANPTFIDKLWIGMYDELTGLTQVSFKWNSGTTPTYTNWAPNQPEIHTSPADNNKCVSFIKQDANQLGSDFLKVGQWTITQCDYKLSYICKKPFELVPLTMTTTYPGCPEGFIAYERKCFKNNVGYLSWQDAEASCKNINAHLISIIDRFEQYWLTALLSGVNEKLWIGLSDLLVPGTYAWSNKDPVTFTNWDRNQPDGKKSICVAMNPTGFWENQVCDSKFTSLCMTDNTLLTTTTTTTPAPPKCATSWTDAENYCYKIFEPANKTDLLNWFEAESYCKVLGGHLASFQTRAGLSAVATGQQLSSKTLTFWIGLNILDKEKGYQWTDASPVSFTNWQSGQPDNVNNIENCVEIRSTQTWYDHSCYLSKGWMCKIEKGIDPTLNVIQVNETFTVTECEEKGNSTLPWIQYNEKCYYATNPDIASERLTWAESDAFCRKNGGFLVSIHSQNELRFITSKIAKTITRFWIGLSQLSTTSGFVWSDGTPVNFVNWAGGEPNNANGGENCAEMLASNSLWNDANCGSKFCYVCEKLKKDAADTNTFVQPLSFGDGKPCPAGYSTFGVTTTGGTGESDPCVFPFKYNGKLYFECINIDKNTPWCATTADYDRDGKWGNCVGVKCFRFVEDKKGYVEARNFCATDKATLASINNNYEQAFITASLRNRTENSYFTGGYCPSDTFVWEDNTDFSYTKWAPGKPGTFINTNNKCVAISSKASIPGLWENVDCNLRTSFICSKYAFDVKYAAGCEDRVALVQNKVQLKCETGTRIVILKADFGRDKYSIACDSEYHSSSLCTNRVDTEAILKNICGNQQNCNISVNTDNFPDPCPNVIKLLRVWYQCVGVVTSSNGKPCRFPFKYNNIEHYQCTYEDAQNFNNKKWCRTNEDTAASLEWGNCPSSPIESNGCDKEGYQSLDSGQNCYKLFSKQSKTWHSAQDFCKNEGGNLVSIRDAFEQAYVSLIKTGSVNPEWIGLVKNDSSQFYWSDNWQFLFSNWASGWIAGVAGDQLNQCGFLNEKNSFWNSTLCTTQNDFICKISKEILPEFTTQAPGYCPSSEWIAYGSNCFRVERTTRSFGEAKFDCANRGATVASLGSKAEMEFVTKSVDLTTPTQMWIGLVKNLNTGTYEWDDGSSVVYTSYASSIQIQSCIYMLNNLWYDSDCYLFKRVFVCKRPKIIDTTIPGTVSTTTTDTRTTTTETTTTLTTTSTTPTTSSLLITTTIKTETTSTTTTEIMTKTTEAPTPTETIETSKSSGSTIGIIFGVIIGILSITILTLFLLKRNRTIDSYLPPFKNKFKKLNNQSALFKKDFETISIINNNYK